MRILTDRVMCHWSLLQFTTHIGKNIWAISMFCYRRQRVNESLQRKCHHHGIKYSGVKKWTYSHGRYRKLGVFYQKIQGKEGWEEGKEMKWEASQGIIRKNSHCAGKGRSSNFSWALIHSASHWSFKEKVHQLMENIGNKYKRKKGVTWMADNFTPWLGAWKVWFYWQVSKRAKE